MSNESGGHVVYKETGSTAFSFSGFQWCEIKLKAAPCPSNKPPDHSRRPSYRAGGFSYKNTSSLLGSSKVDGPNAQKIRRVKSKKGGL